MYPSILSEIYLTFFFFFLITGMGEVVWDGIDGEVINKKKQTNKKQKKKQRAVLDS